MDVKDELKNTSIQITCLDEDGNVLKRVTSGDSGDIEETENTSSNPSQGEDSSDGGTTGGSTGGGTGGGGSDGGDDDGGADAN